MSFQAFQVLTEFRFEIGQAVLGSNQLQSAVMGVSQAADQALTSFQRMSLGVVAHLGVGPTSLLGVLGAAISSTDKFASSQLSLANLISANKEHLVGPIDTFNQRMEVSATLLKEIGRQAQKFALPSKDLLETVKLTSAILIPKGLAGTNLKGSIDLGRNLLKSAPNLGIHPQEVQGQLLRAIEGGASMGDTLFRRLSSETGAFRENKVGGANAAHLFNALTAAKRVEILQKAMAQFASDTDVLTGRVNTLTGQLQRLRSLISGDEFITTILRPLGNVLVKPIVGALNYANNMLEGKGRAVVQNLANFLEPLIEDPKKLFVTLLQLRKLQDDTKTAGSAVGIIAILGGIRHLMHAFPALGAAMARVLPIGLLGGAVGIGGVFMLVGRGLAFIAPFALALGRVLLAMIPGLAMSVAFFQLLSRASALAKVQDAENLVNMSPRLTALLTNASNAFQLLISPFTEVFNRAAELIAPLFMWTFWMESAAGILEVLVGWMQNFAIVLTLARATIEGIFFAISQLIENFSAGNLFSGGIFDGVGEAFTSGIDSIIERNLKGLQEPGGAISNTITNIGKVEIKNEFKEQMEPDRIAFSLVDQMKKAATNPTGGRNNSFGFASAAQGAS